MDVIESVVEINRPHLKFKTFQKYKSRIPLYIMLIPGLIFLVIFAYIPMVGISIAFQNFNPAIGLFGQQIWCGFDNFIYLFQLPGTKQAIWNTVYISFMKIFFGTLIQIAVSIMINEVRSSFYKRYIQTIIYLPFFLSWIILSGIFISMLSPTDGIINNTLQQLGIDKIFFLGDNKWFPTVLISTDIWKNFGFGTIIYLATITSIDPQLYESASMDGATRWQKVRYITLPEMRMIIVLLALLSLGNILNAGFDQVFNLYSPLVKQSGDILDTLVYRLGIVQAQYGVAAAAGLFKSAVSLILISTSYYCAYKYADYKMF